MIDLTASRDFKMVVFFGHRELKQFSRLENGQLVCYGYSIDYDKDGNETGRTEPSPLSRLSWLRE